MYNRPELGYGCRMDQLIEALQIMARYGNVPFPTHCEHDVLYVYPKVAPAQFTAGDVDRLEELGFQVNREAGETLEDATGFYSFRFGSC